MPETPDFDEIARQWIAGSLQANASQRELQGVLAVQLRLIWNARGAADVTAVAAERASDAAVGWIATVIREQDR